MSPVRPLDGRDPGDQTTRDPAAAVTRSPTGPVAPSGSGLPPHGLLTPGQMFGARYTITRLLGEGGMGAVYEATDGELGVQVALKVIRPEITENPAAARELERRFKRELLLARQVTHKNVVRIHDLGDVAGVKYISMSYIEGCDLATLQQRERTLPVARALRIMWAIASGLQAAHEAGVVHRDLKPANVMIDAEGEALIMDFGIARSSRAAEYEEAAPGGSARPSPLLAHTMSGSVLGTVSYMAPEQARGEAVDQRADIYALGLIAYDMLSRSRREVCARNRMEELQGRIEAAPSALASVEPAVPPALSRIVMRCLQPNPGDRYQTTGELMADLERLDAEGQLLPVVRRVTRRQLGAAAAAVVALLAVTWWAAQPAPPPVEPSPTSVLIADFDNRTGDPVFEGAVEQALSLALEGARYITVFRTNSARALAAELTSGKQDRITDEVGQLIARREGIRILIAGTVTRQGSGYGLELQVKDPATGGPIATDSRTVRTKEQVLTTIQAMAARVREALGESRSEMERLAAAETVTAGSLEAMRAYARAQELTISNKVQEALDEYQRAVQLDPRLGRAYAGMGVIFANYFKDQAKAEANYKAALQHLDRMTERERYRTLGTYYLNIARNYEQAIENYETLVRLYPADDGGHGNLALAYLLVGDVPRALAQVQKSLQIYPRNSLQRYNYAMYSMYAGDFATAIAEASRLEQENPTFEYNLIPLGISQLSSGDEAAAARTYARLSKISAFGASFAALGRADAAMYRGRYADAVAILLDGIAADMKAKMSSELAPKYVALAEARLAAGERGRAADAARQAVAASRHESILFPAGRVLALAGRQKDAEQIAADLENMLQRHTIAYSGLVRAEVAAARRRPAEVVEALREAEKRHDSWFSRFLLGKAYVETGHHAEGLAELEVALKRRGETTDAFFTDRPTLRYLPPLYYWLGRAREGVGVTTEARESYNTFLALRTDADPPDPLVADARTRLGRLTSP